MRLMSDDLSKMFEDLKDSNSFLEASFNDAKCEASEAKQKVCDLELKSQNTQALLKERKENCKSRIILEILQSKVLQYHQKFK